MAEVNVDSSNGTNDSDGKQKVLPWGECDLFCINDYAATAVAACGWRGRLRDARRNQTDAKLVCPRCGCATLLRIPLEEWNGDGSSP